MKRGDIIVRSCSLGGDIFTDDGRLTGKRIPLCEVSLIIDEYINHYKDVNLFIILWRGTLIKVSKLGFEAIK